MNKPKLSSFKRWFVSFLLKSKPEQGYVLMLSVGIVIGLAGLVALYAKTSRVEELSATATVDSTTGFSAAESALNLRASKLKSLFDEYNVAEGDSPLTGTVTTKADACFDDNDSNNGTGDFACEVLDLDSTDTRRSGYKVTTYVTNNNINGQPTLNLIPKGAKFQNLNAQEYSYSIYALAFKNSDNAQNENSGNANNLGKQAIAILQMDSKVQLVPMFQFAAFYKDDLEILPGPTMVLSGPVHTNGDLYLGGDNLLRIRGQVTTAKNIYSIRKNKKTTLYDDGKVQIDNLAGTALNLISNASPTGAPTDKPMDTIKIATNWGTQIQTGIIIDKIPDAGVLTTDGEYYKKADIRITYKPAATSSTGNMNYLKNNIPFDLSSIDRTNNNITNSLTDAQKMSLLQPVMVGGDIAAIPPFANPSAAAGKDNVIRNPFHACKPVGLPPESLKEVLEKLKKDDTKNLEDWWKDLNDTEKSKVLEDWWKKDNDPDEGLTDNQKNDFGIKDWWITLTDKQKNDFPLLDYLKLQTWWDSLTVDQKNTFREVTQKYLLEEIHSLDTPLLYTFVNIPITQVKTTDTKTLEGTTNTKTDKAKSYNTNLYGKFAQDTDSLGNNNELKKAFSDNNERKTAIDNLELMTAQQIAGLPEYNSDGTVKVKTARCFVAAPLTDIGRDSANHLSPFRFFNERENRDMRLLQMNIQSMTIWNRDGVYLGTGKTLLSSANLLFRRAPQDNTAPEGSFQKLGLAAIDTTEDGIVLHATITPSAKKYKKGQSPYGFAIVKGQQLFGLGTTTNNTDPTGLSIATDQALYVQGDYNVNADDYHSGATTGLKSTSYKRLHNKQPASFLADSFQPLSNACITKDIAINHFTGINCDVDTNNDGLNNDKIYPNEGNKIGTVLHTEFNVAILSGTDVTIGGAYNGGLENYPRFLEHWGQSEWRYRGSFVSISKPLEVSGAWGQGDVYSAPLRPWDYDTAFNDAKNLPPLTPRFVYLTQESFIRSFEQ